MANKILVTGATGKVGTELIKTLLTDPHYDNFSAFAITICSSIYYTFRISYLESI